LNLAAKFRIVTLTPIASAPSEKMLGLLDVGVIRFGMRCTRPKERKIQENAEGKADDAQDAGCTHTESGGVRKFGGG
jgi:hypothetical protein